MSSTKQYTPTTTARPTWREREALKERQQREAATRAAEEQQRRTYANTEENFPTTMRARNTSTRNAGSKFAELANKWQVEEEIERQLENYRRANSERERDLIRDTVVFLRSRRTVEDDDELSTIPDEEVEEDVSEKYPTHGKRGTNTEPDSEGWRTIVKRTRKQKRTLTEAELAQKYRDEFFGHGEDGEDADVNGDLTDRNQRRQFY